MFDLGALVKNIVGYSFRLRGKEYFIKDKIKEIYIYKENGHIEIGGKVKGDNIYNTNIRIISNEELGLYCTCDAFENVGMCKHISGLAMKIDHDYKIFDNFDFFSRKTGKKIDLSGKGYYDIQDEEYFEYEEPSYNRQGLLADADFLRKMQGNSQLLEALGLSRIDVAKNTSKPKPKKEAVKQQNVDSNKLTIFSKMFPTVNEKQEAEKELFKIKLDFDIDSRLGKDIDLHLYKCKILKNGKLSTGTIFRKRELSYAPIEFQKLDPFLDPYDGSSGYRFMGDHLSFISGQNLFIMILKEFKELYTLDNKLLTLHQQIHQIKFDVTKDNTSHGLELLLVGDTHPIPLFGFKIFGAEGKKYGACLTGDNHLFFYYSDFSFKFIKRFTQEKIKLSEEDFRAFQKKNTFVHIIENCLDPANLNLNYQEIPPKIKLKIEIPDDFRSVKMEGILHYDDLEITPENQAKAVLIQEKKMIKRDQKQEKELLGTLSKSLTEFDEHADQTWIKYVDDEVEKLFDEIDQLIKSGMLVEYKQPTKRLSMGTVRISLKVQSKIDFFDIESKVMLGEKEIDDAKELLSLAKKGPGYITLKDGNTLMIRKEFFDDSKNLEALGIEENNIGKSVSVGKYNIGLLRDDLGKDGNLHFELDDEVKALKEKFKDFKKIPKVSLVKTSKITLRDYQKTGVDWLFFLQEYHFSGILADDMGLGKTIQTLAFLEKIYSSSKKAGKTLIVCPTSLVLNWLDEATKFTPELKVQYIKDGKSGWQDFDKDTQVILVSYGIIANIVEKSNIKEKFEYVILDEAQNIKNPVAQRTKSILQLKSKHRLALTGTPIENNLAELWSIFNFLMPGFLGTLNHFKSQYASGEKAVLEILSRKVKPFILRRTKEEVLKELPPKVEEYIKLEMGSNQKAFYDKLKNTYKVLITKKLETEGLNKSRFEVLDALLKLRQACLMPELVKLDGNKLTESIKLDYLDENIEEMVGNGHNLLIFSQFTGFLSYIKTLLDQKGIAYNYLDGQTAPKDRKKLVDSFNAGNVNIFIISLKAGGTGLNLTAADYVIHLDPWWNPAVENQATDRAHRMGQQKTVFVQKLIVKDSIEEKILQLQENKKKLIDDIFSGNFSGSLDKHDIDFIFS